VTSRACPTNAASSSGRVEDQGALLACARIPLDMPSLRFSRRWTLLLLIYIAIDFMDPSIPGVFFFDNDALFMDGAVQAKSDAPTHLATLERVPFEGTPHDREAAVASLQGVPQPSRPQYPRWKNLKHDDSSSFASPPDSSPAPLLS
jgi:hypothetical protein